MTQIILEKYKYDELEKIKNDFYLLLEKRYKEIEKDKETEIANIREDTTLYIWLLIIISIIEFIIIIFKYV